MLNSISDLLSKNQKKIIVLWQERAKKEIPSAAGLARPALANGVGLYLQHLTASLSASRKMDINSIELFDRESIRIAKLHGNDRAGRANYILEEVIMEFKILREVIFQEIEKNTTLPAEARDIILDSIENAIAAAAAHFSEVHEDIRQKFINTLTHDLRNPISAAKSNAQLILKRLDQDVCANAANRIVASLNRLDSMISDLLDASRLRAGEKISLEFTKCDLDSLTRNIVDEFTLIHGDRFSVQSDRKVIGTFGSDGLRRAIENLLTNAIKYSSPHSQIVISLEGDKDLATIRVHNEGTPIPAEEKDLLFQQYRRSKSAEKQAKSGWGLGLTLVKGVVDAHEGSVQVESSIQKGTDFILKIPSHEVSAHH